LLAAVSHARSLPSSLTAAFVARFCRLARCSRMAATAATSMHAWRRLVEEYQPMGLLDLWWVDWVDYMTNEQPTPPMVSAPSDDAFLLLPLPAPFFLFWCKQQHTLLA
jgi:hypothetical protein